MSTAIAEPPPAPAPAATVKGDVAIPEVSDMSGGAQGVKPAPPGTIPQAMRPYSDRPDSAKSKSMERLRAKVAANDKSNEPPKPAAKTNPAPKADDKQEEPDEPVDEPEAVDEPEEGDRDPELDALVGSDTKTKVTKDGQVKTEKKKENPWHLLKAEKAARAAHAKELEELRKQVPSAETRKSEVAELEKLRKERNELLENIRYKDYEQHPEFKEKYDAPYKDAWKVATRNLRGITKVDDNGRAAVLSTEDLANDLLELVNMPTLKAQDVAEELYGDAANVVMIERDKIKTAFDNRMEALNKSRTEGTEKEQARMQEERQRAETLSNELKTTYEKANEYHAKDPRMKEFFQPIEGDEEANTILEAGYKMVDEAFSKSPMDPSLTEKERATLVKKHAAVRHRSAGFGRVRYLLAKERAATSELRAKLAEYEGTVPGRQASRPAVQQGGTGGSRMAAMQERLRARASR